jgi:toxin FitB
MRDVVIDTDAASLLQRRQAPPWVLRQLADARIWLTFITVGELANWAVLHEWDEGRRERLDAWTARRPVIPYDARVARLWGELVGQAQLRGQPRPHNHIWIAACCLRYQVPLVALDPTGFDDFAEHHGLVLLGDRTLPIRPGRGRGRGRGPGRRRWPGRARSWRARRLAGCRGRPGRRRWGRRARCRAVRPG